MKPRSASDYLDELQRQGRYGFDRRDLETALSVSPAAVTKALNRLAKRNRVRKIRKGFHAIIPVEFSGKSMIPPDWFIDDLMRYLGCAYYIGLQSAAAHHGAAHQQVQEFQVVTPRQELPIRLPQLTIRFFCKLHFGSAKTQMINGHAGMLPVSTPESTALDLIRYANRIGGADTVITILQELADSLDAARLRDLAGMQEERASLQRLGWFLDRIRSEHLADTLHGVIASCKPLSRIKLDPSGPWETAASGNRWRIIENIQPESDL
jgi:predicted transcriptional regulator of viral defense system